jgi:hypothetical protein
MDVSTAEALRRQLINRGSVTLPAADGQRLYVVHSSTLGDPGQSLLIAFEGGGVLVWCYADDPKPLNRFRLMTAGFRIDVAEAVATLLEGLVPDASGNLREKRRA